MFLSKFHKNLRSIVFTPTLVLPPSVPPLTPYPRSPGSAGGKHRRRRPPSKVPKPVCLLVPLPVLFSPPLPSSKPRSSRSEVAGPPSFPGVAGHPGTKSAAPLPGSPFSGAWWARRLGGRRLYGPSACRAGRPRGEAVLLPSRAQ